MGKSIHFSGQPLYSQIIKLPEKSKIQKISSTLKGERYIKRFDCWTHTVVMLYAVIMRFDSLREITASLQAEARKLNCTKKIAHCSIFLRQCAIFSDQYDNKNNKSLIKRSERQVKKKPFDRKMKDSNRQTTECGIKKDICLSHTTPKPFIHGDL